MKKIEADVMNESSIADYLLEHPEFFERHAVLLNAVQLSSGHGHRAVSLQERQAQMLREKIKGLEARIVEMLRNSSDNAGIARKIHQWSCSLAAVQDVYALPNAIAEGLRKAFDVPQVGIRVWGVDPAYMHAPFTKDVTEDVRIFATSLTEPFCGPNLGFEPMAWMSAPEAVQSVALLALRDGSDDSTNPAYGLLILGSPDPKRFEASMGTMFLSRIAEQASAALQRLRVPPLER